MTTATWIIAISTTVYAIIVIATLFYIANQVKQNKLQREATALKDVYDYLKQTHKYRKKIYADKEKIKAIQNQEALKQLERTHPEVTEAIHEVANCYHYIGFLMRYGLLTNKPAIFEEGGDTILHIVEIIKPVIKQEREKMDKETYKQYLEYLVNEIRNYKKKE